MTVCIWDVQTVTCLRRITPQGTFLALLQSMPNLSADRDITSLMWSDDAMQIVGGCADDRTMHTWSAISGDWVGTSEAGLQDPRASPDGTLCAIASGSHVPICRKGDPPLPQRIFSDIPHALSRSTPLLLLLLLHTSSYHWVVCHTTQHHQPAMYI
jgi:WD40 repeat protein